MNPEQQPPQEQQQQQPGLQRQPSKFKAALDTVSKSLSFEARNYTTSVLRLTCGMVAVGVGPIVALGWVIRETADVILRDAATRNGSFPALDPDLWSDQVLWFCCRLHNTTHTKQQQHTTHTHTTTTNSFDRNSLMTTK